MDLQNSLIAAWDWSQKWGLPINPAKCKYLAIGREVPPWDYPFSPWVWHPHPCIQISQGSRGSGRQCILFHCSVHWSCKWGKTIDLHNKTLFYPIIQGFSASTPRPWYASLFAKPCGRYQSFRANSKIRYKVGNWHSSPPLQRETAAAGPSFLATATTSGRPYWY